MNETSGVLRVFIDGSWSAHDLSRFCNALHDLYNLRLILERSSDNLSEWEIVWSNRIKRVPSDVGVWAFPRPDTNDVASYLASLVFEPEYLRVVRVNYGSPGNADFKGVAGIVETILERFFPSQEQREEKKLSLDEKRLRNDGLRIENTHKYVRVAKELGYTETQIRQMVRWTNERQAIIADLSEQGKVIAAEMLSEEDKPPLGPTS